MYGSDNCRAPSHLQSRHATIGIDRSCEAAKAAAAFICERFESRRMIPSRLSWAHARTCRYEVWYFGTYVPDVAPLLCLPASRPSQPNNYRPKRVSSIPPDVTPISNPQSCRLECASHTEISGPLTGRHQPPLFLFLCILVAYFFRSGTPIRCVHAITRSTEHKYLHIAGRQIPLPAHHGETLVP